MKRGGAGWNEQFCWPHLSVQKFCPLSWEEEHTRHQKKMESLRKCYRHYSTSSDGVSWAGGC